MYRLSNTTSKPAPDGAISEDAQIRPDVRPPAFPPPISPSAVVGWIARRWYWPSLFALAGIAAGAGYGQWTPPRYTAYTDLLVPPANLQVLPNDIYPQNLQSDSQLLDIESKLRLLNSGNVLRRVSRELDLPDSPEFNGEAKASTNVFALLDGLLGNRPGPVDKELEVMRTLAERISAKRVERSYMVTIAVWARGPETAARIADATAKAFQEEVAQADADAAGRAASGLKDRLAELKKAASEAEEKVAQFKRSHGLQTTSNGELLSAQTMAQISTKLVDANTRLVSAQARYDELTATRPNETNPLGTLQSATLTSLRAQHASTKQTIDSLSMTYGSQYPGLVRARSELRGIQQAIKEETNRILRAAQLELDQATATVNTLKEQAERARIAVAADNEAQVQLNDLQRDMTTKIAIYQTFLTRAGETAERQLLNSTNIRVISAAIPPASRSWPPRTVLLAAGGLAAGFGFGAALAAGFGLLATLRRVRRQPVA